MSRFVGFLGIVVLLLLAYLLSTDRRSIRWRTVLWGLGLQVGIAVFVLRVPLGQEALASVSAAVTTLISFADRGSEFVFGWLVADPAADKFVFAFRVLPIVIFISSLFSCLYYLGVMQLLVLGMAKVMTRLMQVSGAESLAAAANVFMGQTEAPIIVAPYVPEMTQSELMALMTGGMATVSGAVLGGYIGLGVDARYLIGASVMAAPASLVFSKMLVPETGVSKTAGRVTLVVEKTEKNLIDAAARGAGRGMTLAINIAAMLIAFISIIFLFNGILGWIGEVTGVETLLGSRLSFQALLGYLLAPLAFLLGVPVPDIFQVGHLIGLKVVLNEFVAYVEMVQLNLQPRSELIATYALCGFANLGSIGIQIGGVGGLAPSRRSDLARLGPRAVLAGSLASFLTAAWAGILT